MGTKGWSFVGQQWWMKKRESYVREGEKRLLNFFFFWLSEEREQLLVFKKKGFLFFYYFIINYATCLHLSGAKRAHFPFWLWPILSNKSENNLTFETLKFCLGLCAISLVPVPRVSLCPSGPVFESKQYIYQNAQNRTPRVVQRLVSLNFKSHAKQLFLY